MPRSFSLVETRNQASDQPPPPLLIPELRIALAPPVLRSFPIGFYFSSQNSSGELRVFSFNGYSVHVDFRNTEYVLNTSDIPILVTIIFGEHRAKTLLSPGESIKLVEGMTVLFDPGYASYVSEDRVRNNS